MTPQQIVNRVYKTFVVKKSKRSIIPGSWKCLYGNPANGPGCAAACLFDKTIREQLHTWENKAGNITDFRGVLESSPIKFPEWAEKNKDLIADLQGWHDDGIETALFSKEKRDRLRQICSLWKLKYPGDRKGAKK